MAAGKHALTNPHILTLEDLRIFILTYSHIHLHTCTHTSTTTTCFFGLASEMLTISFTLFHKRIHLVIN